MTNQSCKVKGGNLTLPKTNLKLEIGINTSNLKLKEVRAGVPIVHASVENVDLSLCDVARSASGGFFQKEPLTVLPNGCMVQHSVCGSCGK